MRSGLWFATLPRDVQEEVVGASLVRTVAEGGCLFREGDPNSGLHCLLKGRVNITAFGADDAEILMVIVRPGEWTGFLANLDGGPHMFTATCATDCQVAQLSSSAVERIFGASAARFRLLAAPEIATARRNYHYLLSLAGGPPLQRLAYRLLDLARGPQEQADRQEPTVIRISQEKLASATRLSRQTVNQLLSDLGDMGLVERRRGSVRLNDIAGLQRLAQNDRSSVSPR